jgi:hypothetical protein
VQEAQEANCGEKTGREHGLMNQSKRDRPAGNRQVQKGGKKPANMSKDVLFFFK